MIASGVTHGFRPYQYSASNRGVGGWNTFWKVDFHTLEANVVSVVDEAGSRITSELEAAKRDGKLKLEVELVFGSQKRFKPLEWLER